MTSDLPVGSLDGPGRGPFRQDAFPSRLHDERLAAWLGLALGATFSICFVTGLVSHLIQQPPGWFTWPARPLNLYRVNQGLHVVTGVASIPLLLAKLWVVYPHFWTWPPFRNLTHLVERLSLVPLVGGSLFLLYTGVLNTAYWYDAMPFFFPAAHYWAAWLTIGGLVIHIAAKTTATAEALRRADDGPPDPEPGSLTRRGFLGAIGATMGVIVLAIVGQTIPAFRRLAVLAPRQMGVGPQGVPVNKTAKASGVTERALSASYLLRVEGRVKTPLTLTLDGLRAKPHHEAGLPITCVEGWSASARWRGVSVRDLLAEAGAEPGAEVRVESLQETGEYSTSMLNTNPTGFAKLLLAINLASDAILLPVAVVVGTLLARLAPIRVRPVVQAGLLATGVVSVFALPFVLGFGRIEDSPSVLPRNYAQGLLAVLAVIWVLVAVISVVVVMRTRPAANRELS